MHPSILFVGTYLDAHQGSRAASQDLAFRLESSGWTTSCTSRLKSRPSRLSDMLRTVWTKRGRFEAAVIDVYSGAAFAYAEAASWWLRRLRKPYVLTLHGGQLPEFARRFPRRVRRLLASAAAVTAPSRYLQDRMRGYHAAIRHIPNAIDITRYPYRARREATPTLTWLRAFHRVYNPVLAVDVAARLHREFPQLRLEMAGPDKDGSLTEVIAAIRMHHLGACVEAVGPVSKLQVPAFLNRSDVFLNTTTADNTPVSVIEAMACGLCVVTTDAGGLPYLLEHGHDSLQVPCNDAAGLAAAITALLVNPALAARLSENARRKAETFDWGRVLPMWMDLLEHVAARCEVI